MYLELDNFLTGAEVDDLRAIARQGPFEDGASTFRGDRSIKRNEQLSATQEQLATFGNIMTDAFGRSAPLQFFSQATEVLAPMLSRYGPGMAFGHHLDHPFMGKHRSDLSMTVFLNDPASYDGGGLILDTDYGEIECKLEAGSAVCYSTLCHHEVETVTRGERLALVAWFQSRVRDPFQRSVLFDVGTAANEVAHAAPNSDAAKRLQRSYQNMQRVWSEN